jgi:hypothetical protein
MGAPRGVQWAMKHHALRGLIAACIVGAALFSAGAAQPVAPSSENIALAQAFSTALNNHDVDALVALFTDEDAGPMVYADRYAWQKYEIRLWAEEQVVAGIHTVPYNLQVTEHGATWSAELYRDDFRALGLETVPVTNSIWVHNGKLAVFTSTLDNAADEHQLGALWRPATAPSGPIVNV